MPIEHDATECDDTQILDDAGRALFRFGRIFARMPRRDLFIPASRNDPDVSAILLVQAVEDAEMSGEAATVGVLADRLGIDPSTASRLIAQAVRSRYLRRVAVQDDGRAVALVLTDTGRELAAGAARYQRSVFDEATREWPEADRVAFAALFVRFTGGVARMLERAEHRPSRFAPADEASRDDGSRMLAVVAAWHAALNDGDADRVAALAHADVEMAGPKGDAVGTELLRDWATQAGIRLEPRRWFHQGNQVVVEQHAAWRDSTTGVFGPPAIVATVFDVHDGLVHRIARYPDLESALKSGGLDLSDETTPEAVTDWTPKPQFNHER